MDWYLKVVRDNYANFEGRARRKEFWIFALINFLIYIALDIIINLMASLANSGSAVAGVGTAISVIALIVLLVYALAMIIPSLAVTVRRLHDTDRSGWWILIGFVPFVGGIILLILEILDSTPGSNRFGPNPKENAPAQAEEVETA